jgi:hypothetical protein
MTVAFWRMRRKVTKEVGLKNTEAVVQSVLNVAATVSHNHTVAPIGYMFIVLLNRLPVLVYFRCCAGHWKLISLDSTTAPSTCDSFRRDASDHVARVFMFVQCHCRTLRDRRTFEQRRFRFWHARRVRTVV